MIRRNLDDSELGRKVFVYRNLQKHCWSIRALEGPNKGKVICHARSWDIEGVEFKVSEAGRQRVLRQHRKNVHAGAVGTLIFAIDSRFPENNSLRDMPFRRHGEARPFLDGDDVRITYNPYANASFVKYDGRTPIFRAGRAYALEDHAYASSLSEA